jgi:hypothetical protein
MGAAVCTEPWINVVVQPTPCVTWDKKHGWVTTWPTPAIIYECGRAAFCRGTFVACNCAGPVDLLLRFLVKTRFQHSDRRELL